MEMLTEFCNIVSVIKKKKDLEMLMQTYTIRV